MHISPEKLDLTIFCWFQIRFDLFFRLITCHEASFLAVFVYSGVIAKQCQILVLRNLMFWCGQLVYLTDLPEENSAMMSKICNVEIPIPFESGKSIKLTVIKFRS